MFNRRTCEKATNGNRQKKGKRKVLCMKIPLYDNNMNFVTTFDLHYTLEDLLKKWGYVHVSLPKPIPSIFSFSYGDNLEPSLSVYQIRIRLEYMIRNGEKRPFYFVEADSDALEFLQHYDENNSYQISDTNYQKWKTSQIEKYAKSSPKIIPTPSAPPVLKASKSVSESESESISISNSPSMADEEDDFFSASPSVSLSEAPEEESSEDAGVKAGTTKVQDGTTFVYTGSQWLPVDAPAIKTIKVEKPKKQSSKKKIGLPKEQLKRNIILE